MRWCRECVLPDTRPNLVIDATGVCNACRTHGQRADIDWERRASAFRDVVARAKSQDAAYDAVIPVSGGKDSTWQVVSCLEHGLRPLAVTWRPPGRTQIGQANLDNLIRLGVDHVDYSINPAVEARFMLETFRRLGDPAIPMHLALFNIPLNLAVRFGIPLVVWGENSASEYGHADDAHTGFQLDANWLRTYGVSHGTTAQDWVGPQLTRDELTPYRAPDRDDLQAAAVLAVFLGYYFPWDPETTLSVARSHGFRSRPEGPKVGLYDYADIDDDFISVHHFLKWHKFGFTRLFDNLSLEIRNGRMTRDRALDLILASGTQEPTNDIARFCDFVGIDRAEFDKIADSWRNDQVWSRQADGTWVIDDFLLDDWEWT